MQSRRESAPLSLRELGAPAAAQQRVYADADGARREEMAALSGANVETPFKCDPASAQSVAPRALATPFNPRL